MKQHSLPLYRKTKKVNHWKDVIRKQDAMTAKLKEETQPRSEDMS